MGSLKASSQDRVGLQQLEKGVRCGTDMIVGSAAR